MTASGGVPAPDEHLEVASVQAPHGLPQRRWAIAAAVGDVAVAVLASAIARLLRFGLDEQHLFGNGLLVSPLTLGVVVTVVWPVLVAVSGAYDYRSSLFGIEEVRRILRSGLVLFALFAAVNFVGKVPISRGFVGVLVPAVTVGTAFWRLVLRNRVKARQLDGRERHRAVVVGPLEEIYRVCVDLQTRPYSPVDVVAFVADDMGPDDDPPLPLRRLVRLPSRHELGAVGAPIDLVLRAGQPARDELWSLARLAHHHNVSLAIAPARADAANVAFSYLPLGSTPLLMVESPSFRRTTRVAKALFDRIGALVLLVLLLPVLAVCALLILLRDGRPVFYRQSRVGREGRLFEVVKFRTMVVGAEDYLDGLRVHNEAGGPLFKMKDDPRVTITGGFLRRHSLDELPQLLNVLKGEMALVGPRPPLPAEVATYDQRAMRRLLVRPGITGLWQVSGRSELGWDEGIYLDLMYIDHWSALLDLAILARTALAVVRPRGAY